jgi:hypothetical protein
MNRNRKYRAVSAVLTLILALVSAATAEWKEKVLYSFQGGTNDGSVPAGGVVFDSQGNLYGATTGGGPAGTVFQLRPPAHNGDPWTETLIYQFQGVGSKDGSAPNGGLIMDAAGNLYGVTAYGGAGDCLLLGAKVGCGTVYEISPPTEKAARGRRPSFTASPPPSKVTSRMETWCSTARGIYMGQPLSAEAEARPATSSTAAIAWRYSS